MEMNLKERPLFDLGRVVATQPVNVTMENDKDFEQTVLKCLDLHANGDFGILSEADKQANLDDLDNGVLEYGGGRILSRYHTDNTPERDIYIQTLKKEDIVYTCVMFCNEY